MQFVAGVEKGVELVKDVAAFSRANPGQAALNKLTLYQAAKELRSDFRMAGGYVRKARRSYRRGRRFVRKYSRKRKRSSKPMSTKRKRMINSTSVSKASFGPQAVGEAAILFGQLVPELVHEPPAAGNALNLNVRDNANVFIKGYKFCRYFKCATTTVPVMVSYALIQWQDQVYERVQDQSSTQPISEQFFRDLSSQTDRHANFLNYNPVGGNQWSMNMNCANMNPSRGYNIIWHKKKVLYPRVELADVSGAQQAVDGGRHWYWKIERYVKVNKNFTYRTREATRSNTPFMELYWVNTLTPGDLPNEGAGFIDAATTWHQHGCYFSDTKGA